MILSCDKLSLRAQLFSFPLKKDSVMSKFYKLDCAGLLEKENSISVCLIP